jgi:hypothetical protein
LFVTTDFDCIFVPIGKGFLLAIFFTIRKHKEMVYKMRDSIRKSLKKIKQQMFFLFFFDRLSTFVGS